MRTLNKSSRGLAYLIALNGDLLMFAAAIGAALIAASYLTGF